MIQLCVLRAGFFRSQFHFRAHFGRCNSLSLPLSIYSISDRYVCKKNFPFIFILRKSITFYVSLLITFSFFLWRAFLIFFFVLISFLLVAFFRIPYQTINCVVLSINMCVCVCVLSTFNWMSCGRSEQQNLEIFSTVPLFIVRYNRRWESESRKAKLFSTDLLSSISLVRQTTWLANARLSANYVFFFFFVFDSNVYRNASLVNHSTHRSHVCFLRVNCVSMCVCIWWWRSYCAVVVVYFVLLCRCYYCQCSVVRVSKISTTHVFGYMRYIVAVILFHIRIQSVYQGF